MAIFKCKMCGGELELQKGVNIAECPYCGTKQTVPYLDDDKKLRLYNRANQYRLDSEFDKAYSAYETIISEKRMKQRRIGDLFYRSMVLNMLKILLQRKEFPLVIEHL